MHLFDDRDPTDVGLSTVPDPPRHRCVNGWTGDDDRPIPCHVCRPHLAREPDRGGLVAWRPRPTPTGSR